MTEQERKLAERAFNAGWSARARAEDISTEDMWAPNCMTAEFRDEQREVFIKREVNRSE